MAGFLGVQAVKRNKYFVMNGISNTFNIVYNNQSAWKMGGNTLLLLVPTSVPEEYWTDNLLVQIQKLSLDKEFFSVV